MTGPARVLVADPPWPFGDKLPGNGRGAAKHYGLLSVDDIATFPRPALAADAHLFLWRVASMQPEALAVVSAWGFTVKTERTWVESEISGSPSAGQKDYRAQT